MAIHLDKHIVKAYKRRKQSKVINFTFLQSNFILISTALTWLQQTNDHSRINVKRPAVSFLHTEHGPHTINGLPLAHGTVAEEVLSDSLLRVGETVRGTIDS
jgi:hypothetical protein